MKIPKNERLYGRLCRRCNNFFQGHAFSKYCPKCHKTENCLRTGKRGIGSGRTILKKLIALKGDAKLIR
jgi:hypothetical protein